MMDTAPSLELIVEQYDGEKKEGVFHGNGIAYFKGGHKYTGQFQDGYIHGIGVYIWNDSVTYKGEFLRNSLTGTGQYHWPNGSKYQGVVRDGIIHGYGTFSHGQISYTGEWEEGKRCGRGRMKYDTDGKSYYDGNWLNNKRHGWGFCRYKSGNFYTGQWDNNMREGKGMMCWLDKKEIYAGEWRANLQDGRGRHLWFLDHSFTTQYLIYNIYNGEWREGKRQGTGTFFYFNGAQYNGEWLGNMKHGMGKLTYKDNTEVNVIFFKDKMVKHDGSSEAIPNLINMDELYPQAMWFLEKDCQSQLIQEDVYPFILNCIEQIQSKMLNISDEIKQQDKQALANLMREQNDQMKKAYFFYSTLGYNFDIAPENSTITLNSLQMQRFIKDCQLHQYKYTTMDLLWILVEYGIIQDPHCPWMKILFSDFLEAIVTIAHATFYCPYDNSVSRLSLCVERVITKHLIPNSCQTRGFIFTDIESSQCVLDQVPGMYKLYIQMCQQQKLLVINDLKKLPGITLKQYLIYLKRMKIISEHLTLDAMLFVLSREDQRIATDAGYYLEKQMTFLEFYEALLGCAQIFVPDGQFTPGQNEMYLKNQKSVFELIATTEQRENILHSTGVCFTSINESSKPNTFLVKIKIFFEHYFIPRLTEELAFDYKNRIQV